MIRTCSNQVITNHLPTVLQYGKLEILRCGLHGLEYHLTYHTQNSPAERCVLNVCSVHIHISIHSSLLLQKL